MFYRPVLLLLTFLFFSTPLLAQLCQGSLGDPLVNITFGSGQNPGSPLNAAATSYLYTAADCPADGSYTVRSQTNMCFGGWHSLPTDHTGDPNGYFMLINASFEPGVFYVDTVDLACSNTTYEFAAWVVNMNSLVECSGNPIRPNLTFIIERTDGTDLQSYNTSDISAQSSASWRQFGFFFTTPPLVNRVVLKIRNNAPGGCGNDLALDDITFRPCGPKLDVTISGGTKELDLCQGTAQEVSLTGSISPGFDNPILQWQRSTNSGGTWANITSANNTTLLQDFPGSTPAGTYQYRLTAAQTENSAIVACRVASEVLTVNVNSIPAISAAAISPLCEGATLRLNASGGATYNWTGSGGFAASGETVSINNIQLTQGGRYYVTGIDAAGCQNRDSVDVAVRPKPTAVVNGNLHSFCEGEAIQLVASGGISYQWSPATGLSSPVVANPVAAPADSTAYNVVVTNLQGCTDSALVMIGVYKKPIANAGPDKEIGLGQQVVLSGAVSGTGINYMWTPTIAMDDATKLQPTVSPTQDQAYMLTVTSTLGCGMATDSVRVKVYKDVFVPTAFTPNGDGKNDDWRIFGLSVYPSYEILVFNRYGQVIYRSTDASDGWNGTFNGKPVPIGTYPYLIRITSQKKVLKGLLTVIR